MIKRAVIRYLIQWSSHSWYYILSLRNYPAPTAPHVFIASSTHVKLKSNLCTWYLIIACCTTMHNRKMSKAAIYSTSSRNRYAAIRHICGQTDRNFNTEYWLEVFWLVYTQVLCASFLHWKVNIREHKAIAYIKTEPLKILCETNY